VSAAGDKRGVLPARQSFARAAIEVIRLRRACAVKLLPRVAGDTLVGLQADVLTAAALAVDLWIILSARLLVLVVGDRQEELGASSV